MGQVSGWVSTKVGRRVPHGRYRCGVYLAAQLGQPALAGGRVVEMVDGGAGWLVWLVVACERVASNVLFWRW